MNLSDVEKRDLDRIWDDVMMRGLSKKQFTDRVQKFVSNIIKNLPNELKGVSNNGQKEKVCCICKATKFRDANIICNKCKDEHR